MDRLQAMRVFLNVVQHGSFSGAARSLQLSNSAVTRHVTELEKYLGTRLLNRTTRSIALTEVGKTYLTGVRKILADIQDTETIASSSTATKNEMLRIYATPGFGHMQLSGLLTAFSALHPNLVLDVTLAHQPMDLVTNEIDIGIYTQYQKFDGAMAARQLGIAEVILCASPAYISRHGMPRTPDEISTHDCLSYSYDQLRHRWPVNGENGSIDVPVGVKLVSNSGALLFHAALAGRGIMLLPSFAISSEINDGRLIRLMPEFQFGTVAVTMAYPSRRMLPSIVRSFVDFITTTYPQPESDPWRENTKVPDMNTL